MGLSWLLLLFLGGGVNLEKTIRVPISLDPNPAFLVRIYTACILSSFQVVIYNINVLQTILLISNCH